MSARFAMEEARVSGEDWITIDERFCGPPRSGNGGYVCGLLAARVAGPVAVRLKQPPPIAHPLRVETDANGARLLDGDRLIAEARPRRSLDVSPPPAPGLAEASRAAGRFAGFADHNFPTCFVCGPERAPGDGLRIFPGPLRAIGSDPISDGGGTGRAPNDRAAGGAVGPEAGSDDRPMLAAVWTPDSSLADPDGRVRPEFVWAALDCPGAFVRYPLPPETAIVLGELAVDQTADVRSEAPSIVTAWSLGEEGRKRRSGTAIFDATGRLCAQADAIWIEVPAEVWR
ncbi:MAG: hypothetical protein R3F35_11765 [Myxococcota bacterium]